MDTCQACLTDDLIGSLKSILGQQSMSCPSQSARTCLLIRERRRRGKREERKKRRKEKREGKLKSEREKEEKRKGIEEMKNTRSDLVSRGNLVNLSSFFTYFQFKSGLNTQGFSVILYPS